MTKRDLRIRANGYAATCVNFISGMTVEQVYHARNAAVTAWFDGYHWAKKDAKAKAAKAKKG